MPFKRSCLNFTYTYHLELNPYGHSIFHLKKHFILRNSHRSIECNTSKNTSMYSLHTYFYLDVENTIHIHLWWKITCMNQPVPIGDMIHNGHFLLDVNNFVPSYNALFWDWVRLMTDEQLQIKLFLLKKSFFLTQISIKH